nr:hypothetical protein [Tanacetum cinerariifolium]
MALIMRTKPGLDTLSFDDLYNNLKVFERDVKGTTASSSNTQNVAFASADNTSSTNDINGDDIEEMDLKWQVAMISMRIKKFHKRTGRKDGKAKGNQDIKRRDTGYNGNKARDNGRRPAYQDDSKALVTIDGEDIDWSGHVEEDAQNYAMMAYSSSNSGSNNEDDPHRALKDKRIFDSGCSRHMTGNKDNLADYQEFKGGFVAFGGSNGRITGKGKIKADSFNLKNNDPSGDLACLFVKASIDESNKWHRRLGPKEANNSAGIQANDDQSANSEEIDLHKEHFVLPIWSAYSTTIKSSGDKIEKNTNVKTCEKPVSPVEQIFLEELEKLKIQEKEANDATGKETTHENQNAHTNSTNILNTVSTPLSAAGPLRAFNDGEPSYHDDPLMPHLEDIYASPSEWIFTDSSYDAEGVVTDFNNLETIMNVSLTPTIIVHTIHPKNQILRDPMSAVQTRNKVNKNSEAHALVWILVDFPFGKKAIRAKWVYRNKKDEKGVVVRNKARLVTQGHRQEEGIDYDEYAFLYGTIDKEVYVTQPPSFVDPKFPNKVYKIIKALYGLHQAPRAWYATLSTFLEKSRYKRGAIHKTLFIKQDKKDIMLLQVYVDDIIFGSTKKSCVKTASTPIETHKPLVKDKEAVDVDVHLYRSMIGSLTYLTASRPDIMFAVCACSRFQVTSNTSHLQAVKRIFRYLKGQPKLGLWYPKVSSFDSEAYSNSDYAGANLDRKSITGGCQFLGRRLISWQCKKQTIMATSTIEVEYVAAAYCRGQVLWIQNQVLDYGFNKINTKFYIDNESLICIAKNLVFHSKIKHIEIRHHFIKDAYEKKLIQVLKIHTNDNVADLLTMAFDVSMFNFLIVECWSKHHTTNGHQFTMSNLHQELTSPEANGFCKELASPKQMTLDEEDKVRVLNAPTPPSPTTAPSPAPQDLITSPPQAQQVTQLEQDKISQALEILKLKMRVKKLEKKRRSKSSGLKRLIKIAKIDVDEDITLVNAETQVNLGAELRGKKDDDNAATKDVSAAEPTVFDDEEVTMTMAQILIKMKVKKEKDDLEKAKGLQQQYNEKQENIDWNVVAEQIQENYLDNIRKYQSLKRKPVSIAQDRKNMIIYLKNTVEYKMEHFRGMTYDKVITIFERIYNKVQTLFKPDKDVEEPQKKRVTEETPLQESFKKLKVVEVSGSHSTQDTLTNYPKKMFKEYVQNKLEIIPVSKFKVEALQVKYPLIDREIHSEGSRSY